MRQLRSRESLLVPGLLGGAMLIMVAWIMYIGRHFGPHGDEVWYLGHLVNRNGVVETLHGVEYFFAPHNSHLVLLGRLFYSAVYAIAGTHFWVLRLSELLGIVVCVALFFVLARRRTTPWLALAFSVSLLFLGFAQESFLWPFDLHTIYSAAFGLAALLALEREDRKGDILTCVFLVLSVLILEVGLAFVLGAAVSIAQRDERTRRAWIVIVPIVLYAIWWLWAKKFGQSEVELSNVRFIPIDFTNAFGAVAGSLVGVNPTVGVAPEITTITPTGIFVAGLGAVALFFRGRKGGLPPTIWVTLTVLAFYWLTIALGNRPPDSSRYIFVGALLIFLVAADALRGIHVGLWPTLAVFAVIAFALPPNISKMHDGRDQIQGMSIVGAAEYAMLELGGSKIGDEFEPTLQPAVQEAGGSVDVQLTAGQYREVLRETGSLGDSLHEVETAAEPVPGVADATLVTGYGLALKPASQPADQGRCKEVTEVSAAQPAFFELESGGAVLSAPVGGEPVNVALSRFSRGARSVPIGTLQPGEWAAVKIPTDRSKVPWNATVNGPVEICPLGH